MVTIDVDEYSDLKGTSVMLANRLHISIVPHSIKGFIHEFEANLKIEMSNDDTIEYIYKDDPGARDDLVNKLTINGAEVDVLCDFSPADISRVYQNYIYMK